VDTIHKHCGTAVDSILKTCALRQSLDNLTVVMIAFDNFDKSDLNNVVKEE
jgi:hypothetical protein